MVTAMVTKVCPETTCNACGTGIEPVMFDAYLPAAGMWGWVCDRCFCEMGGRLGVGRGQRYDLIEGVYVKTAG